MTTALTNQAPPPATAPTGFRPHRISTALYNRMVELGALGPSDRVFLWQGMLVEKMPKGRPHVFSQNKVGRLLTRLVPDGWFVEQDQPLEVAEGKVPEPDLKVVRGTMERYKTRNPTAADVPLVAEVADASLPDDRGEMLQTYAAAAIPVYWIVNIPGKRIDVYSRPSGPAATPTYEVHESYGPGEEAPVVLDGREVGRIPVGEVLP